MKRAQLRSEFTRLVVQDDFSFLITEKLSSDMETSIRSVYSLPELLVSLTQGNNVSCGWYIKVRQILGYSCKTKKVWHNAACW